MTYTIEQMRKASDEKTAYVRYARSVAATELAAMLRDAVAMIEGHEQLLSVANDALKRKTEIIAELEHGAASAQIEVRNMRQWNDEFIKAGGVHGALAKAEAALTAEREAHEAVKAERDKLQSHIDHIEDFTMSVIHASRDEALVVRIAELERQLAQAVSSEITASAVVLELEEELAERDLEITSLRNVFLSLRFLSRGKVTAGIPTGKIRNGKWVKVRCMDGDVLVRDLFVNHDNAKAVAMIQGDDPITPEGAEDE